MTCIRQCHLNLLTTQSTFKNMATPRNPLQEDIINLFYWSKEIQISNLKKLVHLLI